MNTSVIPFEVGSIAHVTRIYIEFEGRWVGVCMRYRDENLKGGAAQKMAVTHGTRRLEKDK